MTIALELVDIRKRFGSVIALHGASLRVREGSVHGLLGENGAGKTTLVRMASGELQPDGGEIRLHGRSLALRGPSDAMRRGVGMVHQHFALVPAMTVAENVALGMLGRFNPRHAADRVRALSAATGLQVPPDARVGDLPVAAQQRVEILKALGREARILILDEPTAVLAPSESRELLAWLRGFAATGASVVFITHRLHEARLVADELTILRAGHTVSTYQTDQVSDEVLVADMVGQQIAEAAGSASASGPVVLSLDGVSVRGRQSRLGLHDVTLAVRGGELVGIAAVEGAGQRELLRVLSGRLSATSGSCTLPPDVAFIPEDRHRDGIVLRMSVRENIALRNLGMRHGLMPWRAISRRAQALLMEFDIRAPSTTAEISTLSGGNQQKLVVARELSPRPDAIVAENPTRGLDVRAAAAVRGYLRSAGAQGSAVVFYSTDIDEVVALANRVLVVHAGRVREVSPNRDAIGRAMLGLTV